MKGLDSDSLPLMYPRPTTPGEVEPAHLIDGHVETKRVACDLIRDDCLNGRLSREEDILTRRLLRDELKYFARETLHEEFSKMRRMFQDDVEDALRRAEARSRYVNGGKRFRSGKKSHLVTAPQKLHWAAPRASPVMMEPMWDSENSLTLRDVADPSALSQDFADMDSVKVLTNKVSNYSSETGSPKMLINSNSMDTCESSSRGRKLARSDTQVSTFGVFFSSSQDSIYSDDIAEQEMDSELKRMKKSYRRRQARRLRSTAHLPDAMGSEMKERLAHCLEMVLENGIAVLIVLNGIFIGIQTDYQARNLTEALPPMFPVVETSFFVVFFMELVIRLAVYRSQFFVGKGWRWNWFDAILVLIQLIEVGGMFVADHESSTASPVANVGFLRLLRILRLFRILRLVRLVEFIGELKTIISSIANSMRSLCWTLFLLLLMIYIVGILFTQVVFSKRILLPKSDPSSEELALWWGTLDRSVLSLYQGILGGVDWDDLTQPLSKYVSFSVVLLFCLYIAFALLAMMNVITGIFVESALKNAEKEKDVEFSETARALFALSDVDNSGQITWEEFELQIDEPRFHWYMKNFGIDPADAKLLFKLLDHDSSGSLDLQELLSGLVRLRAGAKFMDVMKILHEIEMLTTQKDSLGVGLESSDQVDQVNNGVSS